MVKEGEMERWKCLSYLYMMEESDDPSDPNAIVLHKLQWRSESKLPVTDSVCWQVPLSLNNLQLWPHKSLSWMHVTKRMQWPCEMHQAMLRRRSENLGSVPSPNHHPMLQTGRSGNLLKVFNLILEGSLKSSSDWLTCRNAEWCHKHSCCHPYGQWYAHISFMAPSVYVGVRTRINLKYEFLYTVLMMHITVTLLQDHNESSKDNCVQSVNWWVNL